MKRKLNIDREKPSAEEIRGRKDFQSVLKQYNTTGPSGASKSVFKSTGFLVSAVTLVVAAISVLGYLKFSHPESAVKPVAVEQKSYSDYTYAPASAGAQPKLKINAPLKNLNIPYQHYKVDARKGGEFKSKKGSKIHVPQNAFADVNGTPIKGEIDLQFREFHDPVDFFLCGIPMSYDSAGVRYQFESAGMVELMGYKDLKPVYVIPGKKLEIELNSKYEGSAYNVYRFDTASCNWTYLGKDKVSVQKNAGLEKDHADTAKILAPVVQQAKVEIKSLDQKITEAHQDCDRQIKQLPTVPAEPNKPVKAMTDRKRFNIDVDANEFPEMKQYKSAVFEVGPENKNFSDQAYKITWDGIQLSEGTLKGKNYKLSLTKGTETMELIVYPVFEGKEYETAMKSFNAKFEQYDKMRTTRLATESRIQKETDERVAAFKKRQEELRELILVEEQSRVKNTILGTEVMRSFTVTGFGVYNCDSPNKYPKGVLAEIHVTDGSGKTLACSTVYLVDKSKNALFSFYQPIIPEFEFNPASKNMLWTVAGGKLYILRNEGFRQIVDKSKTDLKMTAVDKEFSSAEEMRAFMGM